MTTEQAGLREHLLEPLGGSHAQLDFERAIAGRSAELRNARPLGLPHTPWRLVAHMRTAQWNILQFGVDPGHISPEFPGGSWPERDEPPDPGVWDRSVTAFRADLHAMMDLVADIRTDLFAPIPHGQGRPSCVKRCWWPTTTPPTWDSS